MVNGYISCSKWSLNFSSKWAIWSENTTVFFKMINCVVRTCSQLCFRPTSLYCSSTLECMHYLKHCVMFHCIFFGHNRALISSGKQQSFSSLSLKLHFSRGIIFYLLRSPGFDFAQVCLPDVPNVWTIGRTHGRYQAQSQKSPEIVFMKVIERSNLSRQFHLSGVQMFWYVDGSCKREPNHQPKCIFFGFRGKYGLSTNRIVLSYCFIQASKW